METPATHPETGYAHVMYALHALSGFMGVATGATVIGAFVFGLPSIIAIIMNFARRDAVRGSWLESHFIWQARTFWNALLIGAALVGIAFLFLVLGIFGGGAGAFGGSLLTLVAGAIAAGIWILYRVIRGWMALGQGKAINV